MARKGVNLLEGDDEEREDEPERGSDDDGGNYERRRGGFVDVLMVILFVCVMLGGVAWAGYQFWWLPKVKKAAQLKQDRMKQEQQRRMRLAKKRGAPERARRSPGVPGGIARPEGSQVEKRTMRTSGQNIQPGRPAPSKPSDKRANIPPSRVARGKSTLPDPAEKAPPAAVAMTGKSTARTRIQKTAIAAAATMKKPAGPPRIKAKPKSETPPPARIPVKKTPPVMAESRKPLAKKKPSVKARGTGVVARKSPRGFYYSVQVASCRTEPCATSFSERLRSKGYSAFRVASTSRARGRGGQITEVRLGSFASLDQARALASRARKNKIGARVYRSGNQWRVAAGSFRNLEDAALLLDRAEDTGFRGELSSRIQSGGTRRLFTIRTGKFASLREALALRKKIRLAGFSDAIVVRRRLEK